jgi:hypothetical protein
VGLRCLTWPAKRALLLPPILPSSTCVARGSCENPSQSSFFLRSCLIHSNSKSWQDPRDWPPATSLTRSPFPFLFVHFSPGVVGIRHIPAPGPLHKRSPVCLHRSYGVFPVKVLIRNASVPRPATILKHSPPSSPCSAFLSAKLLITF